MGGAPTSPGLFNVLVHDTLYKLGVYGVASFYVLSGVSLGYVYKNRNMDGQGIRSFAIKRVFRIVPLFWLASICTLALAMASEGRTALPSAWDLMLNFTFGFGLLAPDNSIPVGGWSIGNEMVFYLAFPALVALMRKNRLLMAALLIVSAVPAFWYATSVITPQLTLSEQWSPYVNPLNQFYLFSFGVALAFLRDRLSDLSTRATLVSLAALVAAFVALPLGEGSSEIVTGWERAAFSLICFGAAGVCFLYSGEAPRLIHAPLAFLGAASYSIYLLHAIVFRVIRAPFGALTGAEALLVISSSIAVTLVLSHVVYTRFEIPLSRLSRRFTKRPGAERLVSSAAAP